MTSNKNHTSSTFWLALMVIIIMVTLSFVPSWNVGETKLKRTNIISELIDFEQGLIADKCDTLTIDSTEISQPIDTTLCASNSIKEQTWSVSKTHIKPETLVAKPTEVPEITECKTEIEDYATEDNPHAIAKFYEKLESGKAKHPIRIAVIGDSFMEGDILSADIREQLQKIYSGAGVGFVTTSSPVAQFRGTIKHTFSGWQSHAIIKRKSAPESVKDRFFVSGTVSVPEEGATVRYEGVGFKHNLKSWTNSRLLFVNEKNSTLNVTINDTVTRKFVPESSPNLQNIAIEGEVSSISISVANPDGFISYGAVLDNNSGVSVDNFAMRGNSGLSLISANSNVCRQFNEILDYDLIILQYGLNVLTADVSNYNNYATQMGRVVEHIKNCFPHSAIIVMGVSDRSVQENGEFITMPTLHNMLKAQRKIALKAEVAFWSIYDAMGGYNSMVNFVARGWGAKDYTHISHAGGNKIAQEFVSSILKGKEDYSTKKSDTTNVEYTLSYQTK